MPGTSRPSVAAFPLRCGLWSGRAWWGSGPGTETAAHVDRFVANSTAVADRIRRFYGREAEVIYPPVDTEFFTPGGERGDEFLFVGRLVSYKRVDLVVRAFEGLPHRLLVVGEGHLAERLKATAPSNVRFLANVDDAALRDLYRSARALVYPADEDFGIVMAEAQACGTPVVALAAGGALDIVRPGETGWHIEGQSVDELRRAVERAATEDLDPAVIRASAERFAPERFRRELRAAVNELVAAGQRRRSRQ